MIGRQHVLHCKYAASSTGVAGNATSLANKLFVSGHAEDCPTGTTAAATACSKTEIVVYALKAKLAFSLAYTGLKAAQQAGFDTRKQLNPICIRLQAASSTAAQGQ